MTRSRTPDSTDSTIPSVFAAIKADVDRCVATSLHRFLIATGAIDTGLAGPAEVAVSGGKRFRALCAYVGAACGNQQNQEPAVLLSATSKLPGIEKLGAALEFYQACALVHDDIIDNSPTRRGEPSAHAHFADSHGRAGLLGNPTEYGRSGGILLGDLLLAGADDALSSVVAAAPENGSVILAEYARMAGEVAQGQFLDMSAGFRGLSGEDKDAVEAALEVVTVKSARYSVVRPAQLGALLAGADKKLLEDLESILEPAGLAFQLRDDHLGAFGDQSDTGKPTGIDIVERKRTVLLALTWEAASPGEREVLQEAYEAAQLDAAQVEQVSQIMNRVGRGPHEALIEQLVEQANRNLEQATLTPGARDLLQYLVGILSSRNS